MASELKPCPFCGEADVKLIEAMLPYVLCPGCHAQGPTSLHSAKLASERYNSRPDFSRGVEAAMEAEEWTEGKALADEYRFGLAQGRKEALAEVRKEVEGWIADAQPVSSVDDYEQGAVDTMRSLLTKLTDMEGKK